jgi:hypothetical protein
MAQNTQLTDIELNALQRIKDKGKSLKIESFEARKEKDDPIVDIAVYAHIDEGVIRKLTINKIKLDVVLKISVVFKHLNEEQDRREGIYPILLGVIGILAGHKLDLKIDPLKPTGFRNITDMYDEAEGLIVFQAKFQTGFIITEIDDEAAEDLLRIGLEYYLQDPADDGEKDAEDVVELEQ